VNEVFREALLADYDPELLEVLSGAELAPSTLAVYDGELRRFIKWCAEFEITPLPASPEAVGFYLAEAAERGSSYQAVKRMHAALSYAHRIRNLPDPCPGQHPESDGEEFDPTWKPFPAAVLRRLRKLANQKSDNQKGN